MLEFLLLALTVALIFIRASAKFERNVDASNSVAVYDKGNAVESNRRCLRWLKYNEANLLNIFILTNCIFFSVMLLARCSAEACTGRSFFWSWRFCSTSLASTGKPSIPSDTLAALILVPTAFNFMCRNTRVYVVVLTWIITVLSIALTALWVEWQLVVPPLLLYGLCAFFIYYESHRQNMSMYAVMTKLQDTLIENERLADETHANELRSMIANVAHDLKTVGDISNIL